MSRRPKPVEPTRSFSIFMRSAKGEDDTVDGHGHSFDERQGQFHRLFVRTRVSVIGSCGGSAHGSSIAPHSMARPQRFSSIE